MTRALRIEYPGAWYHVLNRGRRCEEIFCEKEDYETFVELLKECSEMWNIRVAAYCSISSIIERMKKQMLADRNLKKRVDRVAEGASKSQKQT